VVSWVKVRGYVSCVVGCPYDGSIEPKNVAGVAARLKELSCYEISLGDTIGVGTPVSVLRMLEAVAKDVPVECLAGHYTMTRTAWRSPTSTHRTSSGFAPSTAPSPGSAAALTRKERRATSRQRMLFIF
jgi:hypothetical protein